MLMNLRVGPSFNRGRKGYGYSGIGVVVEDEGIYINIGGCCGI